ncbi:hypothetical protein H0X91_34475 [Burkholderia sp. 9777_1386]|uniref:hypothetical protein n=1 Tax=Burkholderia sp. 9777_1386 TaxID=2751183 RepID=UPI0018C42FDD|nr:hypothetical protein [Burkholderia sp. 9777_1386]MBG0875081.1 hypothetical protein [Burkholderia sp. 9777_1386]
MMDFKRFYFANIVRSVFSFPPAARHHVASHWTKQKENHDEYASHTEHARYRDGYKWSPVKVYRERFRNGITAANWALQASITRRFGELIPPEPQRAVILVTLRALEDGLPVYADGIRALATSNWTANPISQRLNIAR